MILYFLRHGDAGKPRQTDDDARELTKRGVKELRAAAPVWRRLNLRPDVVLTSPLPRAQQTAEILSRAVGAPQPIEDERLEPGAGWAEMAQALSAYPQAQRVMFVGHEPDLSQAVELLTGASSIRLRKGGLACVEFSAAPKRRAGELVWLLDSDLY